MSTSSATSTSFDLTSLRCAAGTDVGMRREENQDSFGVIKKDGFQGFFIADGMGGAQGGATASRMAISLISENLQEPGLRLSVDGLTTIIQKINRRIFERGSTEPAFAGMGTTLVGLVFTPDTLLAVNVGDSRAYRIRGTAISQISEDHTLVKELVQAGTIAPEDAHEHPISHMLTRSLGPIADVKVECKAIADPPLPGDAYVLCSDGLYNYVSPEEILAVVRQNPIDDANQILINLANQRGGADNITAIVVDIGERSGRTRSNPFASTSVESDADTPTAAMIAPAETQPIEKPVIPPPVKEPVDQNAARKALRDKGSASVRGPRPLPTFMILGATLVVGIVLGNFARRLPDLGYRVAESIRGSSDTQEDEGSPETDSSPSTSPLTSLAKQIRGDREESGAVLPDIQNEARRQPSQLERSIQRIQSNIDALSQLAPAAESPLLKQAQIELARVEKSYQTIESNLDVASRAVTLWLGRQVAFEGQETSLDSLSEMARVATYSPTIKEKLAAITSLSFQYRAKADEVELHPEDTHLQSELDALDQERNALKRKLAEDVQQAIKTALAKSYGDYENLKSQRDLAWLDLQQAKREVDIQLAIGDEDPVRRESLRQSLLDRLELEKKALSSARMAAKGSQTAR